MRHSFIVTTYNIDGYVARCLDSLRGCTRPGDEIIVVDDGSDDGTTERVEALLAAGGFGEDVALRPILLGCNTVGGVGIPGNIGLREATGEAVFFVDGDDWLEPAGFAACRAAFETSGADILIGNYLEYDEASGQSRPPADARHWRGLDAARDMAARRSFALSLIAVPWRKFYRRDFLERHRIRFPEGNFFFEDNPFHWQVCERAAEIAFHDAVLCQHRINRPGQTMASTGVELMAFFTHYETIRDRLPPDETELQIAALGWLLNNMSWHVTRLQAPAFWPYANRAAQVLSACPDTLWAPLRNRFMATAIGGMAEALHCGDVAGVVAVWGQDRLLRRIEQMERALHQARADTCNEMATHLQPVQDRLQIQTARLDSLHHIAEFRALRALAAADEALEQKEDGR